MFIYDEFGFYLKNKIFILFIFTYLYTKQGEAKVTNIF